MSGKHQGLRYFPKFLNSKVSERNALTKKVLRCMMAVGFVLSPWLGGTAYAEIKGTIIRRNGETFLSDSQSVANIYVESASNGVGLNHFSEFSVVPNKIANLYFQTAGDNPTFVNTLVNVVQHEIGINGTVNAIRNGQIGGNLYFIAPKGMIVRSSGVINAGSLTVIAANVSNGGNVSEVIEMLSNNRWDLATDANASILIQGQINAATGIDLRAAKIAISQESGSSITPLLKTGVLFKSLVGLDTSAYTNLTAEGRLTATVDTDGKIVIYDPSNVNGATGNAAVQGDGAIKLSAQTATDSTSLSSLGNIDLQAGAIDALGNVSMTANGKIENPNTTQHTIDNSASITAGNNVSITSTNGGFKNNNKVVISATGDVTIETATGDNNAGKVTNQGTIQAGNDVTINAYSLDNDVPGTETLGDISESGRIIAGNNVSVTTDKGGVLSTIIKYRQLMAMYT